MHVLSKYCWLIKKLVKKFNKKIQQKKHSPNVRWRTFEFLDGLNCKSKGGNNERRRVGVCSLACNILGVEGHFRALRWD